jgi:hypothetical protein
VCITALSELSGTTNFTGTSNKMDANPGLQSALRYFQVRPPTRSLGVPPLAPDTQLKAAMSSSRDYREGVPDESRRASLLVWHNSRRRRRPPSRTRSAVQPQHQRGRTSGPPRSALARSRTNQVCECKAAERTGVAAEPLIAT